MGKVLLCTGQYAEKPYFFKSVCVNVYCVEELCYLLAANPFMIDAEIMDRELAEWLDRECRLTELSHQLMTLFHRGSQPRTFVDTILNYTGYCSGEDRNRIEEVLLNNVGLSDYERMKKQSDYYIKNGRYQMAIREYEKLLLQLPEAERDLKASVYHNMGVAYGYLFQFENAAYYFKKAYTVSGREESGIQYLAAVRRQLSEGEYISFIADNGQYYALSMKVEKLFEQARSEFETTRQSRMLTALQVYKEEGNTASYYEEIDRLIGELKEEYRECVAQ